MGFKVHKEYDDPDIDEKLQYLDLQEIEKLVEKAIQYVHFYMPFWDEYGVYFTYNSGNKDSKAAYLEDALSKFGFPVIMIRLDVFDNLFHSKKNRYYGGVFSGRKLKKKMIADICITVYHELAHAIVALDDKYEFVEDENILQFKNEEAYCETFAVNFNSGHWIPDDMKQFYKLYNKYRKKGKLDLYKN